MLELFKSLWGYRGFVFHPSVMNFLPVLLVAV